MNANLHQPASRQPAAQARGRSAFTLIELLVAIGLILILAGMAVLFVPSINEQARAGRGAVQLQGWLNIAKQRALRDQAPRGLRLIVSNDPITGALQVRDCQYVEMTDDFTGGRISTLGDSTPGNPVYKLYLTGALDLYNSNPFDQRVWEVQPGDYVEINGGALLRRITNIASSTELWVDSANPIPYRIDTPTYRILRRPRPTGDEPLTMPDSVAIDVATNFNYGNPLPGGAGLPVYDILFAPSGQVITPGTTTDSINLWVRDVADVLNVDPTRGEPAIIAVFVRSGMVASFPVGQLPTPYSLVK